MKITINGKAYQWEFPTICFEDVLRVAGLKGHPTMAYRCGRARHSRSGIMTPDFEVAVAEGLEIYAYHMRMR